MSFAMPEHLTKYRSRPNPKNRAGRRIATSLPCSRTRGRDDCANTAEPAAVDIWGSRGLELLRGLLEFAGCLNFHEHFNGKCGIPISRNGSVRDPVGPRSEE